MREKGRRVLFSKGLRKRKKREGFLRLPSSLWERGKGEKGKRKKEKKGPHNR